MKRKDFSYIDSILSAIILICFLLFLLLSCRTTPPQVIPPAVLRDSTHILVQERILDVHFTATIDIPKQSASTTTRDSISHLETDFAVSDARIKADGSLYHYLANKPQQIKQDVEEKVKATDTTTCHYREIPVPAPYPVEKPLTRWQKIQMEFGGFALLLFFLWCLYKFVKLYKKI